MNPTLRTALVLDGNVAQSFVERYYRYEGLTFNQTVIDAIDRLLATPEWGSFFFIDIEGGTVGYIVLTYSFDHEIGGRSGVITDFYIEEPSRGQGIGSAIIGQVQDFARSKDLKSLDLVVLDHNSQVAKFYECQGFVAESGRRWFNLSLT